MQLNGHTILITGGASGIGLAIAKRFAKAGSQVIICGRREDQLAKAKRETPALQTIRADVSTKEGRVALKNQALEQFPALDVVINNAGIQNRPPPLAEMQEFATTEAEIATNLEAPIHLAMLFLPHLMQRPSYIMNVTSGLSFAPFSIMPVYCATKAALHSFTLSLRHQLKNSSVQVIEIIPPAVNTDLGGVGLHNAGADLNEFADHTMKHLAQGDIEFGFESSEKRRLAAREATDPFFNMMNK